VEEWARFGKAQPFGIELLKAHFVTHSFMPHTHEGYALGVILGGAERYRYRGESVTAPSGSVMVIAPGEVHTGHAAHPSGWVYSMVYPAVQWLEDAHEALGGRGLPSFRSSLLPDPALARQLDSALSALHHNTDALQAEFLWRGALEQLILRHGVAPARTPDDQRPNHRERRGVAQARARLDADPASKVSLSDLAAAVDLTPSVLAHSFKAALGLAPHTYRLGARVQLARQLLSTGQRVSDVALQLGFADQAHFTRVFKRVVGTTPGVFQQAGQSGRRIIQDAEERCILH
jgi:AraC-like DNA-binding protein